MNSLCDCCLQRQRDGWHYFSCGFSLTLYRGLFVSYPPRLRRNAAQALAWGMAEGEQIHNLPMLQSISSPSSRE
jgi:hypothetical protein